MHYRCTYRYIIDIFIVNISHYQNGLFILIFNSIFSELIFLIIYIYRYIS